MPFSNNVAEQVFGTIGTICWTAQMLPQVWKSWREKSTDGLSQWLVLLWGIASVFQGVYAIVQNINIPLIVQPQLFGFLTLLSWGQCQYYGVKRSLMVTFIMTVSVIAVCGGLEAGLIFAVRPSHDLGNKTATNVFGILASVLISIALFPQYYEIYKYKEVIGLSLVFITVDLLGGVFNDLSLIFKEELDVIALICYTLVIVLDGVIIIAALILNPRARKRREQETVQATLETSTFTNSLSKLDSTIRAAGDKLLLPDASSFPPTSHPTTRAPSVTSTVVVHGGQEAEEGKIN
ncbi:PQ-loop-domain-containing protein [Cyathus striatus]|nr:PQ-loop-domain-containing protein [Cyathus striatus]